MPKTKPYKVPSLSEASQRTAGVVAALGASARVWWPQGERVIQEISLTAIRPDPTQPRQFLPRALRQALADNTMTTRAIAEALQRMEQGGSPEALALLDGDNGLKALAASIKEQGMIQEVGVYELPEPMGETLFGLVYGERRYWAHWWLVLQGHKQFGRIRCARLSQAPSAETLRYWQLLENAQRQDLSAIEKAQAFAALKARLMQTKDSARFGTMVPNLALSEEAKPLSAGEAEEAVAQQLGMSTRAVRHYLNLLNLPEPVQHVAVQSRLSERALRPVLAVKDPKTQLTLARAQIKEAPAPKLSAMTSSERPAKARRESEFTAEVNRLLSLGKMLAAFTPMQRAAYVRALQQGPQAKEARAALQQLKQLAKAVETMTRKKTTKRKP
jgi:ParB-like chromosome segregation protein Spo0J